MNITEARALRPGDRLVAGELEATVEVVTWHYLVLNTPSGRIVRHPSAMETYSVAPTHDRATVRA